MTRIRIAAVGAFVIGGILLFAVGLFLIGDRRMLFEENFEVYAEFAHIAGLQKGGAGGAAPTSRHDQKPRALRSGGPAAEDGGDRRDGQRDGDRRAWQSRRSIR